MDPAKKRLNLPNNERKKVEMEMKEGIEGWHLDGDDLGLTPRWRSSGPHALMEMELGPHALIEPN